MKKWCILVIKDECQKKNPPTHPINDFKNNGLRRAIVLGPRGRKKRGRSLLAQDFDQDQGSSSQAATGTGFIIGGSVGLAPAL